MDQDLQVLAMRLADSAVRNTATAIGDRISVLRAKKQNGETIAALEEMINDLISDKSELIRIAQAFQEELVAQQISSDDVKYITENIIPVIRQLAESGESGSASQTQAMMDLLGPLLSVETVTVLQLLGFNFRRAIGEPLTELTKQAILARVPTTGASAAEQNALALRQQIAFYGIAQDAEAYDRLMRMTGQKQS